MGKTIPELTAFADESKENYYVPAHKNGEESAVKFPLSDILTQGDEYIFGFIRNLANYADLGTKNASYANYIFVPSKGIYKFYAEAPDESLYNDSVAAAGGGFWILQHLKLAPASIDQDEDNRFVTDEDKDNWDGKADAADVYDKTAADGRYVQISTKGAANGVASLDAGGKVPSAQLPGGALVYKGAWNATTNTPALADGTGTAGFAYRVTGGAYTRNLGSGAINWVNGDLVVYNGAIWQQLEGTDAVTEVNGQQGTVSLDTDDIPEGTAKYYTDAAARAAISSTDNALAYDDGTGELSLNKAPQPLDVGPTIIFNLENGYNGKLLAYPPDTLILDVQNMDDGDKCYLVIERDETPGAAQLTLPAGSYVFGTGASTAVLGAAGVKNLLIGHKMGASIYWQVI